MKRNHGKHNKKVCDKLYLQDDYVCNDWVVTTSFYSAIHFIDHALFPCEYEGNKFNNINEAHKILSSGSKHKTREILLNKIMPKHVSEYSFLSKESQNARYVDYSIHEVISRKAVSSLDNIISSYDKEKKDIK